MILIVMRTIAYLLLNIVQIVTLLRASAFTAKRVFR